MRPRHLLPIALLASTALVAGCGDETAPSGAATSTGGDQYATTQAGAATSTTDASGCARTLPEPAKVTRTFSTPPAMAIARDARLSATIETTCGTIVVALDPKAAPKTTNNFVFLARKRYFDGLTIHRVVADFVIQGGDPSGDGSGGPGYQFADELPSTPYDIGDLAMANAGPDTNGSQFFIVTGVNATSLPLSYSRFGKVTSGLDVAQRIEALADPADPRGVPTTPVGIVKVTIAET